MGVSPSKRTHYQVIEDDLIVLDPDAIMAVQIPNVTVETAEHITKNHKKKTPTLINVEDFDIQLYEDQAERNNFWLAKLPYDQDTGALLDPVTVEFDMIIQQLAWDLQTPIRQWTLKGCNVIGSAFEKSEKTSADNQVRTITISPTTCKEEDL